MQNFHHISSGLDVRPLLLALKLRPQLWDVNKLRTTHQGSPHTAVSDIWLRFNDLKGVKKGQDVLDQHESVDYPAYSELPEFRPVISGLMAFVQGERLGRVLITRLAPGKRIDAHVDSGDHAAYYDRFHVVLASDPGNVFRCGDEQVHMRAGETWWFQNAIEHEVINNSASDRLHLIVDIRTRK